jgi:2-dehydro-3-deoxygalactonokinase
MVVPGAALVALDWGTSSLRAWLLAADGAVLDRRRSDRGLLALTQDAAATPDDVAAAYETVFTQTCAEWLSTGPELPAIACGMVGSAHGWVDAGYRDAPTVLELAAADLVLVEHRSGRLHVVPGLRVPSADDRPGDVLRGEETQVLGVLDALGATADADLTVVLPGTHSKWVSVRERRVETFTTAMTGELYGLLLGDSILARTATEPVRDDEAFRRGVSAGSSPGSRGLQVELFGARALALDGTLAPSSVPDYVSGLLLGDEVGHLLPRRTGTGPLVVCGSDDLCRRYAAALAAHGVATQALTEDVTVRGLWRTAVGAGLVDACENEPSGRRSP